MPLAFAVALAWPATCYAEITPRQILTLSGPLDCGGYGSAVSSAGDFNGDGFKDIIVGSPFSGSGRVYVYFGGPNADSLPDMVLSAPPNTVFFGLSISAAGDFNGDGYDDIVVGDDYFSSGFYVYFGGPTADDRPDLFLFIPFQFLRQPHSIATGDVNGDGYSDLVAGFGTPRDRLLVYYGGPTADGLPDLELKAPDELYPKAVTMDLNGDGQDDIVARSASGIRVYFGGGSIDSLEDMRLTEPRIDGQYIIDFASAGDVNGDGSDDLMVTTADANEKDSKIQFYFGGAALDPIPDATLDIAGPLNFSPPVASVGDIDGDGYGDVIVGAGTVDLTGGRLLLYRGGAPMDTVPAAVITISEPGSSFPPAVAAADINGDGLLDGLASLGRDCSTGKPNQVLVYDFAQPLRCRAFTKGEERTIPLMGAGSICLRFQPVENSFALTDVDLSTVRLTSATDPGGISMVSVKRAIASDTDGDGVADGDIGGAGGEGE